MTRFLSLQKGNLVSKRKEILQKAAEICAKAEIEIQARVNIFEEKLMGKSVNAFSQTLEGLIGQFEKSEKEVL